MNKLLILASIFTFSFACQTENSSNKSKPNVILIMADDLGYGGIGCYGNKSIKTPHIDKLAEDGLMFTDFHSNGSVCTPTRAALITGKYQQRSGLEGVIYVRGRTREVGLDRSEQSIAKLLKQAGYKTGIMGKWHLGYNKEYFPTHHGFDTFYGYVSGNVDYHSHYDNSGIHDWWHNLDSLHEEGYVTDLITQHSIDFIHKHKAEPFFLYVPHESPHVPFQGRQDSAYRFSDNEFSYYGPILDKEKAYKEMIEAMDDGVGEIVNAVEDAGLTNNTLIIFISDNGAEPFGHNGMLSGNKISLLEGGHRVPAIFSMPGKITSGITAETVMTFDLLPTFTNMAGIHVNQLTDGVDLSNLLFKGQSLEDRHLFWKYRKQRAVRFKQFKVFIDDMDTTLYNLETDLSEEVDISNQQQELRERLILELEKWDGEISKIKQKTI